MLILCKIKKTIENFSDVMFSVKRISNELHIYAFYKERKISELILTHRFPLCNTKQTTSLLETKFKSYDPRFSFVT